MQLRKYTPTDISAIEAIDFFCSICIRYHGNIDPEDVLCVTNDNYDVIGVGYLRYDKNNKTNRKQKIEFSTHLDEAHQGDLEVDSRLIDGLIHRFHEIKNSMPDRIFFLRICCETDEMKDMQFLLEKGFSLHSVIPVLKYDLLQETKHYQIPDNITIQECSFTDKELEQYHQADLLASDLPESEQDIRFQKGDPNFKCFVATCDSEIVGAISVWNISDERAATENIFVTKSFRRKNIARELIATAFDELKSREMKIATLSMSGTNLTAMKLYLSCGYSLFYNLIEMVYE